MRECSQICHARRWHDHSPVGNNAGISSTTTFVEGTEAELDAQFTVHFKGPFLLTQRLLPLISDGGRIVNNSSGLARFTFPGRAVYGRMKAAVETLSRHMALELGPRRIAANVVAPGAIATDFSGGVVRDNPDVKGFGLAPRSAASAAPRTWARLLPRCSPTSSAG